MTQDSKLSSILSVGSAGSSKAASNAILALQEKNMALELEL